MSISHVRALATPERASDDQDPFSHQRTLAASLIKNLGYEDAVDACRRNGWCGVLKVLLETRPGPTPA